MRKGWRILFMWMLVLPAVAPTAQAQNPLARQTEEERSSDEVAVEALPDDRIANRIRGVLEHIESFDEVTLEVADGVVILQGEVDNAQEREDAATLVERFEGVIWVDNRIVVATDVETRIAPAVDRLRRFGERFVAYTPIGILIILLIILLWKIGSLLARWDAPARRFGWDPLVWGLFRRMARGVLVLIGLLLIFDILGVSTLVGALLGTAGVVGLALGFAFQDIAENYLAGVLLSIRQPFNVNDIVRIGEYEGFVVRLTSRELVLLTIEGNHVRMPNSAVFKSTIINYTRNPRRLFQFDIGVGTGEDLNEVMRIGRELLIEMRGVMDDPAPFVRVMAIDESSVRVRISGWVDQRSYDFAKVRSEAIRVVKEGMTEAGISIPDPRYEVLLKREREEPRRPTTRRRAEDLDVTPDGKMDAQVEEDLASSEEENLLGGGAS